jgi:hypothetical protein
MMTREFSVDGLQYRAMMSKSGNFGFEILGGNSPKESTYNRKRDLYNLYPEIPNLEDVDLNFNALPVFRKAGEILLEWLYTKKPWRIGFSASTQRKVKIYRWFAARLAKRLSDYSLVEYPTGVFNFYRVEAKAEDL